MEELAPVLILLVIFGGIIGIVRVVSESRLRSRLIEKGMVDEKAQYLWTRGQSDGHLNNLKWGMVLVGIGAAALISQFLPYDMNDGGTMGLMLIFGGLAFLLYYPVAQKHYRERQQNPTPPHS
jgi:uncharacterized membrane protein (UPF0136 family)